MICSATYYLIHIPTNTVARASTSTTMSWPPFSLIVVVLLVTNVQTVHLRELAGQYPPERNLATCDFESGVDYVGNDLRSVSGRPASACCGVCFTTPGCGAWSWSKYSGGTCWLKSTIGPTIPKLGVILGII